MEQDLDTIQAYARIDDEPLYDDFEEIIGLMDEAIQQERSMTSASLPDGFETVMDEGGDFGFHAENSYENGRIEIDYTEHSSISFNRSDSSTVEIAVQPLDYTVTENWEHQM